jgi:hypothetical protein
MTGIALGKPPLALGPSQENALDRISGWLKNAPPVRYCNDAECLGYSDSDEEVPHTHGGAQDYTPLSIGGLAGCIAGETELWDPIARKGRRIDELCQNGERPWVQTLAGPVLAEVPFLKGVAPLYRVTLRNGRSCLATADHLFLSDSHWRRTDSLAPGMALLSTRTEGARRCSGTAEGYPGDYCPCFYPYGAPLLPGSVAGLSSAPSHSDALLSALGRLPRWKCSHLSRQFARLSTHCSACLQLGVTSGWSQAAVLATLGAGYRDESSTGGLGTDLCRRGSRSRELSRLPWPFSPQDRDSERTLSSGLAFPDPAGMRYHSASSTSPGLAVGSRTIQRSHAVSSLEKRDSRSGHGTAGTHHRSCSYYTEWSQVESIQYERTDVFYDLHVPVEEHYLADGIWSHNTGKTALAGQLADRLGVRVTFGTPTNKAAWVLRHKLPESQRGRCGTYHSLLFRPNSYHTCLSSNGIASELGDVCGKGFEDDDCSCPRFRCDSPSCAGVAEGCRVESHLSFERREHAGGHRDLLVLDEASMITEEQVEEIRRFGIPVLLCGDHGQLPPVKGSLSPWMLKPDIELLENYRQSEESGIIKAALTARRLGTIPLGKYGTGAVVMNGSSRPDAYNALDPSRLIPGQNTAAITWTNSKRADINRAIHSSVAQSAGKPGAVIVTGDRLVSLGSYQCEVMKKAENGAGWRAAGWQERVTNGMAGTVLDVLSLTKKTADVVIELDSVSGEAKKTVKVIRRIDIGQLGNPKSLRPDERVAAAMDFAYVYTAHKAQGSEFDDVCVIGSGPSGQDRARWLYTSFSRAKERLLVILLWMSSVNQFFLLR